MNLPWSAQQREWLQALGHPLLVLAADAVAAPELAVAAPAAVPPVAAVAAPAVESAPADDGSSFYRALLRATGRPAAEAGQAVRQLAIDPAALRANPAAKRALWPRLRRLRGAPPG